MSLSYYNIRSVALPKRKGTSDSSKITGNRKQAQLHALASGLALCLGQALPTFGAPVAEPTQPCEAEDIAWLHNANGGLYINLNPEFNFATGYADCNIRDSYSFVTVQYQKVKILAGAKVGSPWVVVNGSDSTFRGGKAPINCEGFGVGYPEWGTATSCSWHQSKPVSIDVRGTPFAVFGDASAFQAYGSSTFYNEIRVKCSSNSTYCTGTCGGYCGGCSAGPDSQVMLVVTDQHRFDCGIKNVSTALGL